MAAPHHAINSHALWSKECLLSAIRGLRNGVITGARVRIPYIYQAIGYALLYEDASCAARPPPSAPLTAFDAATATASSSS